MGARHPKASVVMDKPMPEQVHLKAFVAVVMSVPQQVRLEASVAVVAENSEKWPFAELAQWICVWK